MSIKLSRNEFFGLVFGSIFGKKFGKKQVNPLSRHLKALDVLGKNFYFQTFKEYHPLPISKGRTVQWYRPTNFQ